MKIKGAWYLPQLPNHIVVELPNTDPSNSVGELKMFFQGVFCEITPEQLGEYKGYPPANFATSLPVADYILKQYGFEVVEETRRVPVTGAWRSVHSVGLLYLRTPDDEVYSVPASAAQPVITRDKLKHEPNFQFGSRGNLVPIDAYEYNFFNLQLSEAKRETTKED